MSSCEEYRELVSALLDGELSGAQQDEILEHLAACPDCRQYREDLTAIRRLLDWEEAQPPEDMMDLPGMKDEMRRPMMLLVRAKKR